jgi:hypothetical protein
MQLSHLLFSASFFVVACGSPVKNERQAPDAPALEPAVVDVPSPVKSPIKDPALDSAPAKPKELLIPADALHRQLAVGQGYALATAMMINQDVRMLSGLYVPDATLSLPDTSIKGAIPIAQRWVILTKVRSLTEFERRTQGMRVLDDSTLADSGIYQMTLKRTPKDSVLERGRYATTWRVRAGTNGWKMLTDRIMPGAAKKKGLK